MTDLRLASALIKILILPFVSIVSEDYHHKHAAIIIAIHITGSSGTKAISSVSSQSYY